MSHRLSLFLFGWVVATAAGCPSDPTPSTCEIERYRIEGTPLTLLPDARLDTVGDEFALLGTDGRNVHWAKVTRMGVIGDEHVIEVPPHAGNPWFAVAGTDAPADHLVIVFLPAGAGATGMVDLMAFSVEFANTAPTTPLLLAQIPANAKVAMSSGRAGMHAAIAWGVQGTPRIVARILGGDGQVIGGELVLGTPSDFDCLRFSPGKGDMTIGYVDLSGTPPAPTFVGTEINAAGTSDPGFRLQVGLPPPSCVQVVPTATGYGLAWHSLGIGTYLGVFSPPAPQFPTFNVVADVEVRGQPPIPAGLGWMGENYALVFGRENGAEVWPINAMGRRQGVLPVFPSMVGHTGSLSTQPAETTLYATYADYTYADPANRSSGIRFLVKTSCP